MNEEVARVQEPEEEQVSALPEGRAGGRRGETARQRAWAKEMSGYI